MSSDDSGSAAGSLYGMKGYKVTDSSRLKMFGIASNSLSDLCAKGCVRLGIREDVYLALDDGTIIDDEEYFQIVPAQTIIIFYRKTEDITTGADYILNLLKKVNTGYLAAGEKAEEFLRERSRDLVRLMEKEERFEKSSMREEDPRWFEGLDTSAETKEEYMFRKSQDRIRGYFYKFYGDVRKSPAYVNEAGARRGLNECVEYFKRKLREDEYFGCFFDRRCARRGKDEADAPRKSRIKRWKGEDEVSDSAKLPRYDRLSYCDDEGKFVCQGKWNSEECELKRKHVINPYSDRESRILFSTWNFDHRIEKSRTVLPTLLDAIRSEKEGLTVNYEYFYGLLFTNLNLKFVHVVCHDKCVHDLRCDMRYVFKR